MNNFSAKNTFEDIRNFLAGRFMGATRDEFLLEEIIKLIFCKYEFKDIDTNEMEELDLSSLYRKTFKMVTTRHKDIYENSNYEIEPRTTR